ncbi:MAG: hypothetical protein COB29_01275 [Sulfitobacter sp.]|nr:MAG: hypothetical protein COB29_01275 [Sulfitobacter sp.]
MTVMKAMKNHREQQNGVGARTRICNSVDHECKQIQIMTQVSTRAMMHISSIRKFTQETMEPCKMI